ncbi:MAG: rhomboid family intramembrane serine protease [Burkholderiales bacterium]|nr:rhomboid family intramembrane serine protease [Burkholderiales bacterium]
MLILPYQTRYSARSLPIVTLVLIALNVLVYAVLQSRDDSRYEAALQAYNAIGLARIEVPRYEAWLARRNDRDAQSRLAALKAQPKLALLIIDSDDAFREAMRSGRVVPPGDPEFQRWREERRKVDELLDRVFTRHYALEPSGRWFHYLTYQFLHGSFMHLFGNMVVLLLAGPFVEAALGRLRFLVGYLFAGCVAGAAHLMLSAAPLVGASGSISGAMAMLAVLYGTRRVRVFYWVFVYFDTAKVPALALLPVWIINELVQWGVASESRVAYAAHLGGFAAGALAAWLLRPRDATKVDKLVAEEFAGEEQQRHSSLLQQAQEAAARMDTKRAARLYRELVEQHPEQVEHLAAYLNVALLSQSQESLSDAALRVLRFRGKRHTDELRRAYLTIAQPRVLSILPVDEQLRLARRLVRSREDAASLRVLDGVLGDTNLRALYGRQIADCLLGLYTTYTRYALRQQADAVHSRLKSYFPSPNEIGGYAPTNEPPPTIRSSTLSGRSTLQAPDTLYIDLSSRQPDRH